MTLLAKASSKLLLCPPLLYPTHICTRVGTHYRPIHVDGIPTLTAIQIIFMARCATYFGMIAAAYLMLWNLSMVQGF
jgi:hypothetical protein